MSDERKDDSTGGGQGYDAITDAESALRAAQAAAKALAIRRALYELAQTGGVVQLPPLIGINPNESYPQVGLRLPVDPRAEDIDEALKAALLPITPSSMMMHNVAVWTSIQRAVLAEYFPDLVANHVGKPGDQVNVMIEELGGQVTLRLRGNPGEAQEGHAAAFEPIDSGFYSYVFSNESGEDRWTFSVRRRVIQSGGGVTFDEYQLPISEPAFFAIMAPSAIPQEEPTDG